MRALMSKCSIGKTVEKLNRRLTVQPAIFLV